MTVKKAINILENYCIFKESSSKKLKQNSIQYTNSDLRDTVQALGDIMESESEIIREAITQLKTKRNVKKK